MFTAIEGHATCLAFQLSLLCDLRVAEFDSVFGMHSADLPLHPKVKRVLNYYKLPSKLTNSIYNESPISILEANQTLLLNECTRIGCAAQSALLLDRCEFWKVALDSNDHESLQLNKIDDQQLLTEMKAGADRFLVHKIGRHGSNTLHSLEEIYDNSIPKVFDEHRLKE
jgi:enoyl-CoA hydratase/carnithine racemase